MTPPSSDKPKATPPPAEYAKGACPGRTADDDVAELIAALRPFAEDGSLYSAQVPDSLVPTIYCEERGEKSPACFTVGDLRRAHALVAEYGPRLKLWRDLEAASQLDISDDADLFEPARGMDR